MAVQVDERRVARFEQVALRVVQAHDKGDEAVARDLHGSTIMPRAACPPAHLYSAPHERTRAFPRAAAPRRTQRRAIHARGLAASPGAVARRVRFARVRLPAADAVRPRGARRRRVAPGHALRRPLAPAPWPRAGADYHGPRARLDAAGPGREPLRRARRPAVGALPFPARRSPRRRHGELCAGRRRGRCRTSIHYDVFLLQAAGPAPLAHQPPARLRCSTARPCGYCPLPPRAGMGAGARRHALPPAPRRARRDRARRLHHLLDRLPFAAVVGADRATRRGARRAARAAASIIAIAHGRRHARRRGCRGDGARLRGRPRRHCPAPAGATAWRDSWRTTRRAARRAERAEGRGVLRTRAGRTLRAGRAPPRRLARSRDAVALSRATARRSTANCSRSARAALGSCAASPMCAPSTHPPAHRSTRRARRCWPSGMVPAGCTSALDKPPESRFRARPCSLSRS